MKKVRFKIILSTVIIILLFLTTAPFSGIEKQKDNVEIIVYSQNLHEQKTDMIKKQLSSEKPNNYSISSILCIFGHDLETGLAESYTHYYYSTVPRCKLETFKYEVCKRNSCTYANYTLINTQRVFCH